MAACVQWDGVRPFYHRWRGVESAPRLAVSAGAPFALNFTAMRASQASLRLVEVDESPLVWHSLRCFNVTNHSPGAPKCFLDAGAAWLQA